jgi:hypothetical protein
VLNFSDELKEVMKSNLAGIWHGFSEVNEIPDLYTFSQTVASFLDIYSNKGEAVKKGMIGELLAHVLLNAHMERLRPLSILKNMEERHIKKGLDILYYDPSNKDIWYSEVKSGLSTNGAVNSEDYNIVLINRAKNGIVELLNSGRTKLWEKALIEAKLVLDESNRKSIRDILASELQNLGANEKKNTILVSVLYHNLSDQIPFESIERKHAAITTENIFRNHIIVSIQKNTLETIENYLTEQAS